MKKKIKTYIIAIRKKKKQITTFKEWNEIWQKQLRWRQLAKEEREMRAKFKTTIDTSMDTISLYAQHHVEENMLENHSRHRLGVLGSRSKPHGLSKRHVGTETDGAYRGAPTVHRWKRIKKVANYWIAPPCNACFFVLFEGQNGYCTMQIITKWSDEPSQTKTKTVNYRWGPETSGVFCLLLGVFALITVNYNVHRFKK